MLVELLIGKDAEGGGGDGGPCHCIRWWYFLLVPF
jgi:hypothetical protein